MDAVRIDVEGLDANVRALDAIAGYIAEPDDALDQVAQQGVETVRSRIPVVTRLLWDSAGSERTGGDVAVFVAADYAPPVNSGVPSRNIAPAHFLEDGARDLHPQAVRLLEDGINRKIREQGLNS